MGLKNIIIPSATVKVPGNEDLVVRGLGLDSIVFLVRHHEDTLGEMFAKAQAGEMDEATAESLAFALAEKSPSLAAKLIACGTGEPEEWQTAMILPVSIQVDAIAKIGALTFSAEGGMEKLLETVLKALAGTAALRIQSA